MRTVIQRLATDETGAVLVMALVAVLVGALLLTPLLGLMSTGLMGGQIYEEQMQELYAADAGVEDAIWKLQNPAKSGLPHNGCNQPWHQPYEYPVFGVNERNVWVTINYEYVEAEDKGVFMIESEAFALDDSDFSFPLTTIVSYVMASYEGGAYVAEDGEELLNIGGEGDYTEVYGEGDIFVDENIEGDAKVYVEGNLTLGGNIEGNAEVYVKGDLILTGIRRRPMSGNIEDPVTVCVEGDLIVTGNIEDKSRVYVLGNLVLTAERESPPPSGNIQDGAGVCVEGSIEVVKIEDNDTIVCAGLALEVGKYEDGEIYAYGYNPFADCPLCCVECEICCDCPIDFVGSAGGGSGGGAGSWADWVVTVYLINPDSG